MPKVSFRDRDCDDCTITFKHWEILDTKFGQICKACYHSRERIVGRNKIKIGIVLTLTIVCAILFIVGKIQHKREVPLMKDTRSSE